MNTPDNLSMKILFFGDIIGKIGRTAMVQVFGELKKKYQPDVTIANVENIAHGKGVTAKTLTEMKELGLTCLTSGNHVWKKENVVTASEEAGICLLTPANDPRTTQAMRAVKLRVGSNNLIVVNLLGRVFIDDDNTLRCPFKEIDAILADYQDGSSAVLVDVHAEATSEKIALGWYLDGRAAAVLGTHTHIPTSDVKILPKGTGYVTDVGMVGPVDSVLGVKKELVIEKFLSNGPVVFDFPEDGAVEVNGIYLETDDTTGLAKNIEKIQEIVIVKN